MAVGATFRIVAEGSAAGVPEIEMYDDTLVVWGWPGSVFSVFHDGLELGGHGPRTPVPEVPEGMTVSQFLKGILGREGRPNAG